MMDPIDYAIKKEEEKVFVSQQIFNDAQKKLIDLKDKKRNKRILEISGVGETMERLRERYVALLENHRNDWFSLCVEPWPEDKREGLAYSACVDGINDRIRDGCECERFFDLIETREFVYASYKEMQEEEKEK